MVNHITLIALFGLLSLLGQGVRFGDPGKLASVTTHPNLTKANLFWFALYLIWRRGVFIEEPMSGSKPKSALQELL